MQLPTTGLGADHIMARLATFKQGDVNMHGGKVFTSAFVPDEAGRVLAERAYALYMWENGLDPSQYPSLLQLETEIVELARQHLGGDAEVCGNFTSGGTESVMLAVKTARDWARAQRPKITRPNIVLPVTAHPSAHKGAQYFGVDTKIVPVDPTTFKVDVDAVRDAIDDQTILLFGSAVSYAHGVSDPIAELGRLALEHELLLHVDGCIGAFLLPYFRRLGEDITEFDFTVPGVTSISMDFHKYAYAAKGASVVMYKTPELRKHRIFTWSAWPGYTLINPTMQSTKSGGPLAATWAMLNYYGDEGYMEKARRIRDARRACVAGIEAIPQLELLGQPETSLVAAGSSTVDLFELTDEMKRRGYALYAQTGVGDLQESLHFTVVEANAAGVEACMAELARAVEAVAAQPEREAGGIAQMIAGVDLSNLTDAQLGELLGMAGLGDGIPGEMAEVNAILNSLDPKITDRLLTVFFNQLNRYKGA